MKKVQSVIITMMMVLTMLPIGVFAGAAASSLSGTTTVRAGDTISVSFYINGSGIFGCTGEINYNASQLTLSGTTQKIVSPWMVEFNNVRIP